MRLKPLLFLVPLLALLTAGCQPRLKQPLVEIRGLSPVALEQGRFLLRLQLKNPVKRSYVLDEVRVLLKLDPQLHLQGRYDGGLEMGNNATEVLELEVRRTQLSKIKWTAFIDRPGDAMPYTAEVQVKLADGTVWKQALEGRLYKVPGRPWHLRG